MVGEDTKGQPTKLKSERPVNKRLAKVLSTHLVLTSTDVGKCICSLSRPVKSQRLLQFK